MIGILAIAAILYPTVLTLTRKRDERWRAKLEKAGFRVQA